MAAVLLVIINRETGWIPVVEQGAENKSIVLTPIFTGAGATNQGIKAGIKIIVSNILVLKRKIKFNFAR